MTDSGAHDPERRYVDLHMHSTASDGALAPDAVVAAAATVGLAAIALTDHDTLAGLPAAKAVGEQLGIRVVAGVELSVLDGDRELHLLGLHIARVEQLDAELAAFRDARRERAVRIVQRLNELGVPVTIDAVLAQAGSGAVGRPHVARAIVAGGWAADVREVFDRWIGAGRPAFIEKRRLSVPDAIRLVHDAGGLVVLAHPGSGVTRARLEGLRALGLDGVEVRHPSHTSDDVARLTALAEHFSLVRSGGSDWHGASAGPRTLGCMHVPMHWLAEQDALVRTRTAAMVA